MWKINIFSSIERWQKYNKKRIKNNIKIQIENRIKKSIRERIEKTIAKVENCTFSIATLIIILGNALNM